MSEWTNLASLLTNPQSSTPRFGVNPLASNERTVLKDAATSFFERLAELERTCSQFPLARQDPDLRDRLAGDVLDVVSKAYGSFVIRCQGKGMEKCKWSGSSRVVLTG